MGEKGKLIVIEGLDGSGKATQSALLTRRLLQAGRPVREVSFPCYGKPSSALIEMYLHGEFGDSPDAVGPYAASAFYAVDRYASYKKDWGVFYRSGGTVIANRYVTSNLVHQMTKLPAAKWPAYLDWLRDLEYEKFGIPKPDLVLFLDMPVAVSQTLMTRRYNGETDKKDIHEKDVAYLQRCRETAKFAAKADHWICVPCSDGEAPLPMETIADRVYSLVERSL